jgi:hypothetical protein
MTTKSRTVCVVPLIFWICALTTLLYRALVPGYILGWDLTVYKKAMVSLKAGHDPYLDCVISRRYFFDHLVLHPQSVPPYCYVYPPLTLPALRWIGRFPQHLDGTIYWVLYIAGAALALYVCMQFVEKHERKTFVLLAPAVVFFPGLLQLDNIYSGNIAYLAYGAIFAAALVGWRRGHWKWFFLAVLVASFCKATFLTLLAIPVLSARRQWWPAAATGAAGMAIVFMQPYVWTEQFQTYLQSLNSQIMSYGGDFGFHPAGLLSGRLFQVIPYHVTFIALYLFCTCVFGAIMLYLRKRFFSGCFPWTRWIPVMLVGVALLNPRIMEYDMPPITVPMALILWRFFRRLTGSEKRTVVAASVLFLVVNICAQFQWKSTECLLLVGTFAVGSWDLFTYSSGWKREVAQACEYSDVPG